MERSIQLRTAARRVRAGVLPLLLAAVACEDAGIAGPGAEEERSSPSPIEGAALHVEAVTSASKQADAWRESRPRDALRMERIAAGPQAVWLTGVSSDLTQVERVAAAAGATGALPVFVLYNVPMRDCAAGHGAADGAAYATWLRSVLSALGGVRAMFVLEPDALPGLDCLDGPAAESRVALLAAAVDRIRAAGSLVYVDAGHPRWHTVDTMVERLRRAGIAHASGFSINVANTVSVSESERWGASVAREVQKGFVIDTSRNGAGYRSQWCNPPGAGLGNPPSTRARGWLDAQLWIKRPGESDGPCNGGPAAGAWWADYALALVMATE